MKAVLDDQNATHVIPRKFGRAARTAAAKK
jgi:hypothetical protein